MFIYLNKKQYIKLAKLCDRLLLSSDTSLERISIPWLHVVREHPVFLKNYVSIYYPTSFEKLTRYIKIVRNWMHLFYTLLRSCSKKYKLWYESRILPRQIDVLFISHLTNSKFSSRENDFYFGDLPNELYKSGNTVVVALLNHSCHKSSLTTSFFDKSEIEVVPKVVFSRFIGLLGEVKIFNSLRLESNRLSKKASLEKPSLFKNIIFKASEEVLSPGSRMTMRLHEQVGKLVSHIKPKVVVVTYEGHAWERSIFHAIWNVDINILRIGYQHAPISRLQHAIRRKLAKPFNPDQVLTSGAISKMQLESYRGLGIVSTAILGSSRGVKGFDRNYSEVHKLNTCLVVPEGIDSECNILFEFSLDCALRLPKTIFIWRLHPQLSFKQIFKNNKRFSSLPKNIHLSNDKLENDILKSSCILYRGSSAVVNGIICGLRPFYLKIEKELTIDPLYEVNNGREIIGSVDEFVFFIEQDSSHVILKSIVKYCNNFYLPIDVAVLNKIISDHKLC